MLFSLPTEQKLKTKNGHYYAVECSDNCPPGPITKPARPYTRNLLRQRGKYPTKTVRQPIDSIVFTANSLLQKQKIVAAPRHGEKFSLRKSRNRRHSTGYGEAKKPPKTFRQPLGRVISTAKSFFSEIATIVAATQATEKSFRYEKRTIVAATAKQKPSEDCPSAPWPCNLYDEKFFVSPSAV